MPSTGSPSSRLSSRLVELLRLRYHRVPLSPRRGADGRAAFGRSGIGGHSKEAREPQRARAPAGTPPYGRISAIDLDRGEILWQVPHGETPDSISRHPALQGLTIPRTGRPGSVGTLVTKTLLIAGESSFGPTPSGERGAMLRAYDKASGKEMGARFTCRRPRPAHR